VTLIDQEGIEVTSGNFPVNNNLIDGNVELPDFLTDGNYILYANTNSMKNGSPEKMFSKVIEVRKSLESYLNTEISLNDTVYESGNLLTAQIRFSGKDNKPVPAGFAYQLTGTAGEIVSGNNKASDEGIASIKFDLPKFKNEETLKLLVSPSYKGTKTITGIVIPTRYNRATLKSQTGKLTINDFRHLNILVKTVNLTSEKNDKVQLEISVTDEKGAPIMANLSVSASNLVPHQLPYASDNIVSYINLKSNTPDTITNTDMTKYFTQSLLKTTQSPGNQFIVQDKNNSKKLHKKAEAANQKKQEGYSSDRNILDILMEIKPYHIDNGKITFGISTMNSINNQDGALIVVDGIKMGTDASFLNTLPVVDIAHITASTNIMDIQRYSSMNNVGVIEITMKKSIGAKTKEENAAKSKTSTLFWGPNIMTDNSGKASLSFYNNENSSEVLISVDGLSANGAYGSSSIHYSVKR
jgi:hypothetical protein